MKILYLIDSKKYSYHKDILEDFMSTVSGEVLDMSDGTDHGTRFGQIDKMHPDVVITFDLAGHILRTGSDTLSLNNIYTRMAHILFHKTEFYGRDLKSRQNLSMFTYIHNGEDMSGVKERFPDIPNILEFTDIIYKPQSDDDHNRNRENIRVWWDEFRKEAMI